MINTTLLWLLLIPILLAAITHYIYPKLLTKTRVIKQDRWMFTIVGLLISAIITAGAFYVSRGSLTADTEIWNGEITGKDRKHDQYTRTYQCNCVQVPSGRDANGNVTYTRVCQTCYEEHYTVTWRAFSNIGEFTIQHLDETDDDVYDTVDPQFYRDIKRGDPCSKVMSYTNYIKAVPETLFKPVSEDNKKKFEKWIPKYPMGIYNHYNVDRVIPVGVSIPDLRAWNALLSEKLKKLGPARQANAVFVIAKTDDPTYFYALQDAWVGGKKNDIVVVIGAPNFPQKAEWVNIMALTDKDMFRVELRDAILDLPELTASAVMASFEQHAMKFERKRMRDFKYLDSEIDPPMWVLALMVLVNILAYAAFWIYMKYQDGGIFYKHQRRRWVR